MFSSNLKTSSGLKALTLQLRSANGESLRIMFISKNLDIRLLVLPISNEMVSSCYASHGDPLKVHCCYIFFVSGVNHPSLLSHVYSLYWVSRKGGSTFCQSRTVRDDTDIPELHKMRDTFLKLHLRYIQLLGSALSGSGLAESLLSRWLGVHYLGSHLLCFFTLPPFIYLTSTTSFSPSTSNSAPYLRQPTSQRTSR
jgi:hypothetical protein